MIILRQRCYNDPNNESSGPGMGTVALGTLGAATGAIALGRRGFLGANIMKHVNSGWAKTGKFLGNAEMMKSGTRGVEAAKLWKRGIGNRELANALRKNAVGSNLTKEVREANKTNKLVNADGTNSYVEPSTGKNVGRKSITIGDGTGTWDTKNEAVINLSKKYGLKDGQNLQNIVGDHRTATSTYQNTEGYTDAIRDALTK